MLASPSAAHPELTTEQITVLVRAGLRIRLPGMRRALIEQIVVQRHDDLLLIACPPGCSEQQVSHVLLPLVPTVLDDQGITGVQRIRIARCAETLNVALMPAWMPPEVWAALSVSLRDALVGASWVQDVLYGATPIQTTVLNDDRTGAIDHIIAMYAAEYHPVPTAPQIAPDEAAAHLETAMHALVAAEPSLLAIQPDATVNRQEIAALEPQESFQPAEPCALLGVSVPLAPDTAPTQPTYDMGGMSAAAESGDAGVVNTASRSLPPHAAPPDGCSSDIPSLGFTIQRTTNTEDRSVPNAAPQEPMPAAAGIAGADSIDHRRQRRPHPAHHVGSTRQIFIWGARHVGSIRQMFIWGARHVGSPRQNYSPHTLRVGCSRQMFIGDDLRVGSIRQIVIGGLRHVGWSRQNYSPHIGGVGSIRQMFIFAPRHVGSIRQIVIFGAPRVEGSRHMTRGQVSEADTRGNLTSDTPMSWACRRTQDGGMISVVAARSRNRRSFILGVDPARPERLQRTFVWRSSGHGVGTLSIAFGVGPPARMSFDALL
jgi:hypothetical protein